MTSSLEHVINEIVRSTAPVLFIDTCIYLDVIRSPIRTNISKDTAKWAKILTGKAKEKVFWLVTCKTIQDEWQDNVSNVVSELDREAKKMETSNLHFHSVLSSIDNEYVKYLLSIKAFTKGNKEAQSLFKFEFISIPSLAVKIVAP